MFIVGFCDYCNFHLCNLSLKCRRFVACILDLRMKLEPSVQEEPLSSTGGGGTGIGSNNSSANGSLGPMSNYDPERDKTDLIPNTLWTGKLTHKSGSVTTPDGNYIKFSSTQICLINFYLS